MTLLFADAAVEFLPAEMVKRVKRKEGEHAVRKAPRILDVAQHSYAMDSLPAREQRGRPDILHQCLLNTLETPLEKAGKLRVFFQLREGSIFEVSEGTRIPRNYDRFVGVLAKLMADGHTPQNPPFLMSQFAGDLGAFLRSEQFDLVCICTKTGTHANLVEYFKGRARAKICCIVGAFQGGFFQEGTLKAFATQAHDLVSIYPHGLSAGTVAARVVYAYELATPFE